MDKEILKIALDRIIERSTDVIADVVAELISDKFGIMLGKAINEAKLCEDCKAKLKESLKRLQSSSS